MKFRFRILHLKYKLRHFLRPKPKQIARKTKQERQMWCIRQSEKRMRHIRMNVAYRKQCCDAYIKGYYRRRYAKYWDTETKYSLLGWWLKEG